MSQVQVKMTRAQLKQVDQLNLEAHQCQTCEATILPSANRFVNIQPMGTRATALFPELVGNLQITFFCQPCGEALGQFSRSRRATIKAASLEADR